MPDKNKIGVLLPTRALVMQDAQPKGIDEIIRMAKIVEEIGLDSVWVGDSLTAKPRLEPLTTLSAISAHTSRVRLGTAVMLGALRHPVSLAQSATTVDLISEGRLILGMGVGGAFNDIQRKEWIDLGIDPKYRAGRFEELLKIFKPLTRGESVTFDGRHFTLENVSINPISVQESGVPVLVAAHGRMDLERQYKRVSLGDGTISISDYPEEYSRGLQKINTLNVKREGLKPFEKVFYMTINVNHDKDLALADADEFIKLYYGMNIWLDRWGPWGSPKEIIQKIKSYFLIGANTIVVRFASLQQEHQLEIFNNEVLPGLDSEIDSNLN